MRARTWIQMLRDAVARYGRNALVADLRGLLDA